MKLSEKIVELRKANGLSQEDLAERLDVSRQAISRWEQNAATPDAGNVLRLSKLFGVTTDYLLNDDYQSDNDLPKVREVKTDGFRQILIALVTLEVMALVIQFMATVILNNIIFALLSFVPFAAMVGGFEYAWQKKTGEQNGKTAAFRKRFYKITVWLGTYFPVRLAMMIVTQLLPVSFTGAVFECVVLILYLMAVTIVTLEIEKRNSI